MHGLASFFHSVLTRYVLSVLPLTASTARCLSKQLISFSRMPLVCPFFLFSFPPLLSPLLSPFKKHRPTSLKHASDADLCAIPLHTSFVIASTFPSSLRLFHIPPSFLHVHPSARPCCRTLYIRIYSYTCKSQAVRRMMCLSFTSTCFTGCLPLS